MPTTPASPTPYPEINAVLTRLVEDAQTTLGTDFVGLYLYGSLASGDFDPGSSDVDFVVVTAGALAEAQVTALADNHARLAASGLPWVDRLEGAYVPRAVLRRHDPAAAPCPTTNEGRLYLGHLGPDWIIQRHILREQGVVVTGSPLHTLIDPVSAADLRGAVRTFLTDWWAPMLDQPARLRDGHYQAYAVLTLCRARHTLHHGTIASKPGAARWAQATLDARWSELITWALAWEPGAGERHAAVLAFLRETITGASPRGSVGGRRGAGSLYIMIGAAHPALNP